MLITVTLTVILSGMQVLPINFLDFKNLMQKIKFTLLIDLFLLTICSCSTEIDIDLPDYDSEFVIDGLFNDTDTLCIYIGQTELLNDTCYNVSGNIKTIVSYSSNTDTLIESDEEGWYTSKSLIPQKGITYCINVSGENYNTVTGESTIPSDVSFEIRNLQYDSMVDETGESYSTATISFKDSSQTDDYYMLMIKDSCRIDYYWYLALWSDDVLINGDDYTNESTADEAFNLYFSDKLFNGEDVEIGFNFYYSDPYLDDKLIVYFRHITEDYYYYMTSAYLQYSNQASDIWDGSGIAVSIDGNINNGYGIFSGYTESSLKLEDK